MFLILAVESESENFLMLLVLAVLRFVLTIVVESESENIEISYALGICTTEVCFNYCCRK